MYERALGLITDARQRRCPKPFYTVVSMWSGWFSAAMLRYLNQQMVVERRQTAETWKVLHSASMTPILRDFVKESLWLKLKTMERLHPWLREPMLCPIGAVKETHEQPLLVYVHSRGTAYAYVRGRSLCTNTPKPPTQPITSQCFDEPSV